MLTTMELIGSALGLAFIFALVIVFILKRK